MKQMIDEFNLSDKVIVIEKPPRQDVIASYGVSEFLVLPSRWESSPLTPLEGFAFRKAVISSNVYGIPYTVIDEKFGILIDPESPEELSKSILRLVKDKEIRKQFGDAGYNFVINIANSQIMALNTLKIYDEVLA